MKAIADLDEAIRLELRNSYYWRSRGILWAEVNEPDHFERAIADFEQAERLKPDNDVCIFYLAAAWEYATSPIDSRRDAGKALYYVERAREMLGEHWKEAHDFRVLAAAHAEAGDFERAVAEETKAQELYTAEDSAKWGHLRELYRSGQPYREHPGAAR
jgi:tetratricopeptide (TPR) repeat protein